MAQVGVKRLASRNAQHDGAEDHKTVQVVGREELPRIAGIEARKDAGGLQDFQQAGCADGQKPENHDEGRRPCRCRAVPRFCRRNSPTKTAQVRGTMNGLAVSVATSSPSMADSTEIEGVMIPSP